MRARAQLFRAFPLSIVCKVTVGCTCASGVVVVVAAVCKAKCNINHTDLFSVYLSYSDLIRRWLL